MPDSGANVQYKVSKNGVDSPTMMNAQNALDKTKFLLCEHKGLYSFPKIHS